MTIHRTRLHRTSRPGRHLASRGTRGQHGAVRDARVSPVAGLLARLGSDRGDVPGWVMITLMTAAIVVALWAIASEQFIAIFNNAMRPFLGGV